MESISQRPSLRIKWLFFRGKYVLTTWPSDKARDQLLFCPPHLKGQPSLQDSTSVAQTGIEPTGKTAWSCLLSFCYPENFRHKGIWVEKQTDKQTRLLQIAPRNQNKTNPLTSLALMSCSCNSRHRIPAVQNQRKTTREGKKHSLGGGEQGGGGGRRQIYVFLNNLCMSGGPLGILFFFLWRQEDRLPSCQSCWQSKYVSIPLLCNICAAFHITFVFSNPNLHTSILKNLSLSLSRKLFWKLFFSQTESSSILKCLFNP